MSAASCASCEENWLACGQGGAGNAHGAIEPGGLRDNGRHGVWRGVEVLLRCAVCIIRLSFVDSCDRLHAKAKLLAHLRP